MVYGVFLLSQLYPISPVGSVYPIWRTQNQDSQGWPSSCLDPFVDLAAKQIPDFPVASAGDDAATWDFISVIQTVVQARFLAT